MCCIVVIGQHVWARAESIEQARKKACINKKDRYLAYECDDPTTEVDSNGYFVYDPGYSAPKLVAKFINGSMVID